MPGKFAARLQATGRGRPTLLRVDFDTGHGFASTQTQREEEYADVYAFALWQAGVEVK
jgi:prolyl oligopeptidase